MERGEIGKEETKIWEWYRGRIDGREGWEEIWK